LTILQHIYYLHQDARCNDKDYYLGCCASEIKIHIMIFWVMTPCRIPAGEPPFRMTHCWRHRGLCEPNWESV